MYETVETPDSYLHCSICFFFGCTSAQAGDAGSFQCKIVTGLIASSIHTHGFYPCANGQTHLSPKNAARTEALYVCAKRCCLVLFGALSTFWLATHQHTAKRCAQALTTKP